MNTDTGRRSVEIDWLEREDLIEQKPRLKRLRWLTDRALGEDYFLFHGGRTTYALYDESKYCFVYAQFCASVLLAMSAIERHLAGYYFMRGRSEVRNASISTVFKWAVDDGILSESEWEFFDGLRSIRNPLAHFRTPGERDDLASRAFDAGRDFHALAEEDAKRAIDGMFHVLMKVTF